MDDVDDPKWNVFIRGGNVSEADNMSVNFGYSAFAYTPPSGFLPWKSVPAYTYIPSVYYAIKPLSLYQRDTNIYASVEDGYNLSILDSSNNTLVQSFPCKLSYNEVNSQDNIKISIKQDNSSSILSRKTLPIRIEAPYRTELSRTFIPQELGYKNKNSFQEYKIIKKV